MKYLWAPWRMDYILGKKKDACIFCGRPSKKGDEANLILYRSVYAFVMMNKFPYNNGHLMVIPKRHCPDLEPLDDQEIKDLLFLLKASTRVLKKTLHPEGFNIGMNIGKIGGAGVDDHVHFHIVPRWTGDTNFMPVLAETKIIPEYLTRTYQKLHDAFIESLPSVRGRKGRHER